MTRPDGSRTPLILLVLDQPEAALTLGSTLSHFGYSLIFSRNIDDAIGVARAREPHLVVSSFEIRGQPVGLQLAHGLREHLNGIPLLLLCDNMTRARHEVGSIPHIRVIPHDASATEMLVAISGLVQLQPHD